MWDRVEFTCAGREGEELTAVGAQTGREILPYQTSSGEELFILQKGLRDAGSVFLTEQHHNRTWTWIYRLVGWFPTFLGLCCLNTLLELVLDLCCHLGHHQHPLLCVHLPHPLHHRPGLELVPPCGGPGSSHHGAPTLPAASIQDTCTEFIQTKY